MDSYNLIIIGFIIALTLLSMWWAFNTVRQIELQKNFCAEALTSIAKLWRRAKFVPEDAKDRESLYLYRDFLRKFDESECKYPIMVKNGGVRCMTRKEYDDLCGQKNRLPVSLLITAASVLVALVALIVNIAVTKTVWVGIGLSLILPAVQVALALFVMRFNKEKNAYRDGIFAALKENSINFLSITKPFIIVDAYPKQFGKDSQPLYAAKGDLKPEQIDETRDFIVRQKSAETEVVLRNVDNRAEIEQITTAPVATPTEEIAAETAPTEQPTPAEAPANAPVEDLPQLSEEARNTLLQNLIDDTLQAEVEREIQKFKHPETATQPGIKNPSVPNLNPTASNAKVIPTDVGPMTLTTTAEAPVIKEPAPTPEPVAAVEPTNVTAPADDDFSLDAIGQALDAEIAKRNKKK